MARARLESEKYSSRVYPIERIGAMQRKKCFLIAALLFLLTGFVASFQLAKASPSVSVSSVYAPLPIEWIGSGGRAVTQTSDGKFVSFSGSREAHMVRTGSEGEFLWSKTYGLVGYDLECFGGQQTSDGGYMLIGGARGYLATHGDAWLGKTDETGDMLWNRTYGGEGHEYAFSGQQTTEGGYILAGVNNGDFYLLKTDLNGNMEWDKTYGGNSSEIAWSVQQTSDGGYILAGEAYPYGGTYSDCWLVKTDPNGEMEWNKTYDVGWNDAALCVRQTTDGGYIFAGYILSYYDEISRARVGQAWVFKTDNHGEIEWSVGFSGTPGLSNWAQASSVKETSDGGYIVAGYATFEGQTGMVLLKTHSKGSGFDWKGVYMGYGAFDVIQTLDGGYAVAEGGRLIKILAERPLIARFQYSPNNPIIQESILFNATYSYDRNQDITSYSWDFDDGNISSTTNPIVSHRYDRSGTYNVSLTAEDAEGLNSTYSGLVNIPAGPPVARFEYSPNSPVFKESIIFNASSSYDRNQDIVSYLWNFDDANITSTTNPSIVHQYKNPGIYNVSLTVVDAEGLDSSYSIAVCAKNPTSLSISTSSPSVAAGYSVNVTGTLLDSAGVSLKNETVDLFYTFTGVENWTPICSNCTDNLGNYYANWTPPAASYFMIKAVYAGNYTHVESNGNVTVCMLPYEGQYIFSVESNSTISAMSYDNNNKTLSFMTTGKEGTFGYVKVTADKSLVTDIALLKVHVDDVEYNYTATEADQSWVVIFTYSHSVHLVKIELDYIIPEFQTAFLLVILLTVSILLTAVRHRSSSRSPTKRSARVF